MRHTYRQFLEEMSRSDPKEFDSRTLVILTHLLKLHFLSGELRRRNELGWKRSVGTQQVEIMSIINDVPSLKRRGSPQNIQKLYTLAIRDFHVDYPGVHVPPQCPFSIETILGG